MMVWQKWLLAPAIFKGRDQDRRVFEYLVGDVGVFVEVGAHDPVAGSQTYDLERKGWSGILVEPLREYAERLKSMRSALVFETAAGAPEDCGKRLPFLVAGGLSTLRPSIKAGIDANERRLVRVRTLNSILREAGIRQIDFLSIDVEGTEMDVLRGFSLDHYRPHLLLIEDDAHFRDKHKYVTTRGYKIVRRTNLNSWYVPVGTDFPVSIFGHWQFLRKLYLGAPLRRWKFKLRARKHGSLESISTLPARIWRCLEHTS